MAEYHDTFLEGNELIEAAIDRYYKESNEEALEYGFKKKKMLHSWCQAMEHLSCKLVEAVDSLKNWPPQRSCV